MRLLALLFSLFALQAWADVSIQSGFPVVASKDWDATLTLATAAHDGPAGGLMVCPSVVECPGGACTNTQFSDSTASIGAWTRTQSDRWGGASSYDDYMWIEVWTAPVTASYSSQTITLTVSGGGGGGMMAAFGCFLLAGAHATFAGNSDHGAAQSDSSTHLMAGTITSTGSGSMMFGSSIRADTDTEIPAQTGSTRDASRTSAGAGAALAVFHKTDVTSGTTSYTVGGTGTRTYWGYSYLEILAAAGGASPVCGPNLLLGMGCR